MLKLHVVLPYLHLQSHEICFTNVLTLFILLIWNTLTFTSFVLLGTYFFVDQSSGFKSYMVHYLMTHI